MKRRSRFVLACFLTVLFHDCLLEMYGVGFWDRSD